jgi:hypothetical protein
MLQKVQIALLILMPILCLVAGCRSSGIFLTADRSARIAVSFYMSDVSSTQDAGKATDITPNTTIPVK